MNKKIVVIEDDLDAQETYQELLASKEYHVFIASTAKLGIDLATAEIPDLIILDLMIPSLEEGIATLKQLKTSYKTAKIPVVVVSNLDSQRHTALENGADGFVGKASSSIDSLLSVIRQFAET